jgi:tRNA pseudouridine32 synthase/23S rRNA pseudouridine746 synthase
MFQRGEIGKTYRALAPDRPELAEPVIVRNHLAKERGQLQAEVVPGAVANAESLIVRESVLGDAAVYRLTPKTGRTHQLRMHMLGLGAPIHGDPLYPVVRGVAVDDFSTPLQLLASDVAFHDPIDGAERRFASVRSLPLRSEARAAAARTAPTRPCRARSLRRPGRVHPRAREHRAEAPVRRRLSCCAHGRMIL